MSLDWDCESCINPLPANEEEANVRMALIWSTMSLALGSITDENVDEWVFRLLHQKRIGLKYMWIDDDVKPPEVEGWVRRWIGMVTNAKTLARKEWLSQCCEILEKRTVEHLQYYKQGPAEAL